MRDEWKDTMILTWRCCLLSLRNPDTLLTSIMLPGLMMALFVFLFGARSGIWPMWITSCPACFCNVSDNALPRHLS